MSNDSGGPPAPPNMNGNGQEGPLQPIDASRPRPPPNNVSEQQLQPAGAAEPPPPDVIDLWKEVSDGLDKNATGECCCSSQVSWHLCPNHKSNCVFVSWLLTTVVWKKAVDSLECARRHLLTDCPEARAFVDARMVTIISILLEQNPNKIGNMERDCVEKSVRVALTIVKDDLEAINKADASTSGDSTAQLQPCGAIFTLNHILQRRKVFYKGVRNWGNQPQGLPEVRNQMISMFRRLHGFHYLALFMERRAELPKELQQVHIQQPVPPKQQGPQPQLVPVFPTLDIIQAILEAVKDAIPLPSDREKDDAYQSFHEDVLRIANAVMKRLLTLDEDTLKKLQPDAIKGTMYHLQRLYDKLSISDPPYINEYYEFSRQLVLKLITSASLPLKLLGWTALEEIIDASIDKRPPPRAFIVEGAGLGFINGRFDFDPKKITEGGWVKNGCDIQYIRKIPENNGNPASTEDGAGKTLTLFRCTMRSQQKWWFISEADEDQPGTDKDIDYYQHKSKSTEESLPSASGWGTCRSGVDPSPTLRSVGLMVPPGEEENTLECQLAKWAIENGVIELVLGDSIHREIVARSTALIKFLASMCDNDDNTSEGGASNPVASPMQTEKASNPYCLKLSHLLLAWKTCTSKTDAAVSAEIYNLLVSILPSLPEDLAIPLLKAIGSEVSKGNHNFFEVSEFCCAIATITENHLKNNNPMNFKRRVREEILSLQWAILSHEDARTLKSYDNIKRHLAYEIGQGDEVARIMRSQFLIDCREWLTKNSGSKASAVTNEVHALHMVQLTIFIFDSYPTKTVEGFWEVETSDKEDMSSLADLLLLELMSYLNRGRTAMTAPPMRKVCDNCHGCLIHFSVMHLTNVLGASSAVFCQCRSSRIQLLRCTIESPRYSSESLRVFTWSEYDEPAG